MKLIAIFVVSVLLVSRLVYADPASTNVAPASSAPAAKTEDWTVGGKTFHTVTVTKVDPDVVHVLYDGGAGSFPLASLTPELQKKFGYNPVAAAQAAHQRQQQEAATDAMMQAVNAQKEQPQIPPVYFCGTVLQKLPDGVLVQCDMPQMDIMTYPKGTQRIYGLFFVTNLPNEHSLVDNDAVEGLFVRSGQKSYTSVMGANQTVASYRTVATGSLGVFHQLQ